MAGDRSSWPLGRGFDRWYGFYGGETHQFVPTLDCDNHLVQPPRTIDEGYHLSDDLADRAIEFLVRPAHRRSRAALLPVLRHRRVPLAAPSATRLDRALPRAVRRGVGPLARATHARQLEAGIIPPGTALSPRPAWVPAWDALHEPDQKVAARFMECFAAFLSHTDEQIGRLLRFLEESGELDDTMIVLVSDNGASSEGGVNGSINDARVVEPGPGRAQGDGRPHRRARRPRPCTTTIRGAGRWPATPRSAAGSARSTRAASRSLHRALAATPCDEGGGIRRQFVHAIDVAPTILELVGLTRRTRSAGSRARHRGHELRVPPSRRRRRRARAARHAVLRDARLPRDLPPRLEGGDVQAARHRRRVPTTSTRPSTRTCGSCSTSGGSVGDTQPRRRRTRTGRHAVDLWWEQAAVYKVLPLSNRILDARRTRYPDGILKREQYLCRPPVCRFPRAWR